MLRLSERDTDNVKSWTFVENEETTWDPIRTLFDDNENILQNFMYMGAVRLYNGNVVYLYKNKVTRRYINVDNDGNTFVYDGVNYEPTPQKVAKDYVLG